MRGIVLAIFLITNLLTLRAGNSKYDYTYLEAVRQKDMGNYALAFALFKRCVEMAPTASEAHYGLGSMYIGLHNDSLALVTLQNKLGIEKCDVLKDGSLRLFERLDDIPLISKTLYESGLVPVELHVHEADLESYYMKLVGDDNAEHNQSDAETVKA